MDTKLFPFLMFEGQAAAAMALYLEVFKDGHIVWDRRYTAAGPGPEGQVMHAIFSVKGQQIMCNDSFVKHDFRMTPATSLFVVCDDEAEIDAVFARLSEGGEVRMPLGNYGFSPKFGWVDDRFGVSWQLSLPAS